MYTKRYVFLFVHVSFSFLFILLDFAKLTTYQSAALMALLASTRRSLEGARAVVIGRGRVVGMPAALMLMHAHATVSVAHSCTSAADLEQLVRSADIVVAAAGKPDLVRGEWIKQGAIVLDVGITREPQGALHGDVQFAQAAKVKFTV